MTEDFSKAVQDGLKLSKRIYFGKDRAVAPPKPPPLMARSATAFLPSAPMLYAVIHDPGIVDNPDIPSYQPHVYGRCDPPALIPLQMNAIQMNADCFHDTAFVTVAGTWRLHCVMGSRSCDCRVAVPMAHKGSILGVEVSVSNKSYSTQLVVMEDQNGNVPPQNGGFLKSNIFTLTIPQVDGGSNLSIKLRWSQKLVYSNGHFSLNVPFNFPDFVNPAGKKISKREKIQVNVDAVAGGELLCKGISHPLKEVRRHAGSMGLLYESDVPSWSNVDFSFSYAVSSSHINGGVLLESAPGHDFDQRDMFYVYLSPGDIHSKKVFKKEIMFVMDISGSMRGKLIDDTKHALLAALSKLNHDDSFNIIAFNGETYLFSKSMELATTDAVERATEWIDANFVAGGGTNISHPLNTAIEMLSNAQSSVPIIFLVTDGTVEDERQICAMIKNRMTNAESICPRIYTFGIGSFCNHYFLRTLAMIGKGQYDAAVDVDLIETRMMTLFDKASSLILANIKMDTLDDLDDLEVYPSHIPDLSSEGPLILSGRYRGNFPKTLKVEGILADFSNFVVDMKIQNAKDIPVQRVSARDQIEHLTAQAWLLESKQLEQKVAKLSLQTGFMSEYTRMIILETDHLKKVKESAGTKEASKKSHPQCEAPVQGQRMILLPHLNIGFGNLSATLENTPPGCETKLPEVPEIFKAATNCCETLCSYCCCMCCIQCCTRLNNQCVTTLTQLCIGLGCFGCLTCCSEICCSGNEG
ncbi:von Willebrand factor A domain-containing protein DDB_G0292028 isoform X1 [Cajanus cajan]|uniref:Inter-alpha-trypsin inhibitor heavy chain H5 n=1 Tax=Cajanus cajan TaxID=3821 RepID=A0A151SSS0_CAJCA|nr:von Willebrand factor A domain-containing protein DDB_G0292028 isoform X1 [Cajanus cajan]KYP57826.1 Inter-alpha-trypsin inhibitor heavy chain H5 [Cajanus cajan]